MEINWINTRIDNVCKFFSMLNLPKKLPLNLRRDILGPWVLTALRHSSKSELLCFLLVLLLNLVVSWLGLPSIAEAACVWHICNACFQIARITSCIENASSCLPLSICCKNRIWDAWNTSSRYIDLRLMLENSFEHRLTSNSLAHVA